MSLQMDATRHEVAVEQKGVIRRLFERVYSTGELSLVTELIAPDFTGYSAESHDVYTGTDGMKRHVSRLRAAFHGFTIAIEDLHVQDDAFTVRWSAHGRHERPLMGIEPSCNIGSAGEEPHGNRVDFTGVASGVITKEGIKELEMSWNLGAQNRQLDESDRQSKQIGDEEASVRCDPR